MSPSMSSLILSLFFATLFTNPVTLLAKSLAPVSSRITVVGAVFCDTCLDNGLSKHSYFLPGADVHVRCKFNANSPRTAEMISISVNRTTDDNGVYKLEIPSVDGVDCVDGPPIQSFCQATLIGSSISECSVPALKDTTTAISVKSKQENLCVYGFTPLSFKPRKRDSSLCGKKEKSLQSSSASKLFTYPASLPFPFSAPPPSLPFPFPPLPTTPVTPTLFPPPPPSFDLGDPKTWIPHFPLMSPPSPPPPAFNLGDPRTWKPLFPPLPPGKHQKQDP